MENIDELKKSLNFSKLKPKYKLKRATIYESPGGMHFSAAIDPVEEFSPKLNPKALTDGDRRYIKSTLQSNLERFTGQAELVKKHISLKGARVLDIGCGGGLFFHLLKSEGAETVGIELSEARALFAKEEYDLQIHRIPVEKDFWQKKQKESFDVVTLWDVIEHVNYPLDALISSRNLLKPGGYVMLDTPCKDGFYYKFGAFTYALTFGKFPTFLNAMYSDHTFGHKQILSTREMKGLVEMAGLEVVQIKRFHELSFPYRYYLKKMIKSDALVALMLPAVRLFFSIFKIRNKMMVVARKKEQ